MARMLDSGQTQAWERTYTATGQVASETDPAGRRTTYIYASNGIDLTQLRQTTGSLNDLVASFGNYVAHRPQTITDGAGRSPTTALASR
jgi:YD repeat-containing protein